MFFSLNIFDNLLKLKYTPNANYLCTVLKTSKQIITLSVCLKFLYFFFNKSFLKISRGFGFCRTAYLPSMVSGLVFQEFQYNFTYLHTQLIVMLCLAGVLYGLSKILSKKIFNLDKKSAYECGFEPFLILTTSIEISFILVAFIFLIFDLELIFLAGFLISNGSIGSLGILLIFLYLLGVWVMVFFEIFSGILSWPVWNIYNTEDPKLPGLLGFEDRFEFSNFENIKSEFNKDFFYLNDVTDLGFDSFESLLKSAASSENFELPDSVRYDNYWGPEVPLDFEYEERGPFEDDPARDYMVGEALWSEAFLHIEIAKKGNCLEVFEECQKPEVKKMFKNFKNMGKLIDLKCKLNLFVKEIKKNKNI